MTSENYIHFDHLGISTMKRISLLLALIFVLAGIAQSDASIICHVYNSGRNVVFTASGNITTNGLTKTGTGPGNNQVIPARPFLSFKNGTADLYKFTSGPTNFGTSTTIFVPDFNNSEEVFGIAENSATGLTGTYLVVPKNYYLLQNNLGGGMIFFNRTIESMGMTQGTYKWDLANGQYFQLNIGTLGGAQTPDPTAALIWSTMAGLGMVTYRRRRRC